VVWQRLERRRSARSACAAFSEPLVVLKPVVGLERKCIGTNWRADSRSDSAGSGDALSAGARTLLCSSAKGRAVGSLHDHEAGCSPAAADRGAGVRI
jgi:hypothetical protein